MELSKVVQALKILRDEGREDLIKDGVLEEAWVGLKRPRRLSAQGVSAAVAACSPPSGKLKKFKNKSADGRKVSRSPVSVQEDVEPFPKVAGAVVPRRRGTGHLLRRSGVSLARRVAAGGRGVGRVSAVAISERQGARLGSARASGTLRRGRALKQAQLQRNNAFEREAAILDERTLGGTVKMAAPMGKGNSGVILSEKRLLAERQKAEEGRDREEDVIVISDEEQEGQESFGLVESFMAEQDVNFLSRGAGADGLKESSLVRCSSVRSFEGNVSAQNVLQVGEQVDLVDQEGVLVTGLVYGQVGSFVNRDKGKVLLDRRKPALQEVSAGCDAPRFPGRPGGLTVHQDAGRHAGGQSFPVKARAPLIHRKEGRVNSGAVYLTTRETVVRGSLGHGAGSVLENEQPSTSWGAGASFERLERLEETMLDYDDDEDDQDTRVAAPVLQSTVPEVVQGDHSGIRRRASVGNLPRGELGMGMGRIVGGNYGREVCGFGGVDASVQVDDIKEDGAGKSEVTGDVREEDGSKVLQESVQAGGVVGAEVSVKGRLECCQLDVSFRQKMKMSCRAAILIAKVVVLGTGDVIGESTLSSDVPEEPPVQQTGLLGGLAQQLFTATFTLSRTSGN
ncbi:hypothetical protein NDU88_003445 [Pleurodeles waltl]|uniref:Uncharacterized protein n=1 Tax=Pleurodeles waltl TaxID=8319 RepID=A0AAV7W256_PLEWA|nr:hypothetical protein NDU88_003445 [Pleurodeles waltl]